MPQLTNNKIQRITIFWDKHADNTAPIITEIEPRNVFINHFVKYLDIDRAEHGYTNSTGDGILLSVPRCKTLIRTSISWVFCL